MKFRRQYYETNLEMRWSVHDQVGFLSTIDNLEYLDDLGLFWYWGRLMESWIYYRFGFSWCFKCEVFSVL